MKVHLAVHFCVDKTHPQIYSLGNSHLLVHKLTHLPSLSFQLQWHTRLYPAHQDRGLPKHLMVKEGRTADNKENPVHPMNTFAIDANNLATSKRTAQNYHIAPSAEQRDIYQPDALPSDRTADSQMKDVNFKRKDQAKITKLAEKNGKEHRINHNSQTRITNGSTVQVITGPMIAPQDNSIRLQPLAILLAVQVFTNIRINFQLCHLNSIFPLNSTHHKASPLLV